MTQNQSKQNDESTQVIASDQEAVEQCVPAEVGELDLYQKREKIYTRAIEGFYQRIRLFTGWPLLCGYFFLPWINWDGRQAVLFDLPARQFHILNITFWPQDFAMLAWVLAICAFALFLFTSLFGRIWCGYSCPQTVWTSMFMWIEQKTEGSRNQRIKLDAAPWSTEKIIRKGLKHGLWFGLGLFTGFTFIGYFTPIYELGYDLFMWRAEPAAVFWILLFSFATYLNAGWLREQVCLFMCPYARFQAAMFDVNTLIVSYDPRRGEPRGSRKRFSDNDETSLGDCIDCQLCVQVCPTGIDIRDGLQYQCIGCALCIDACDSIMEKMQYPKGLISYTTENRLNGKTSRILRAKVIGYVIALMVMCSLLGYQLFNRIPLKLEVIRDRGQLYTTNNLGHSENNYTLKIINMSREAQVYEIGVSSDSLENLTINNNNHHKVDSGEVLAIPLRLNSSDQGAKSRHDIVFHVESIDGETPAVSHPSTFFTAQPGK